MKHTQLFFVSIVGTFILITLANPTIKSDEVDGFGSSNLGQALADAGNFTQGMLHLLRLHSSY